MNTTSIDHQDWDQLWSKAHKHLAGIPYLRERSELSRLPRLLENVRSFVDVGASCGPYTWVAHYVLQGCDIHCVEANPAFAGHIEKEWAGVMENGESRGNRLHVVQRPVSNSETDMLFQVDPVYPFHSFLIGMKDNEKTETKPDVLTLRTVMLDGLFADKPAPDLIKIDIEGAEWRALDGSRAILKKRGTRFLMEIHPWGDSSLGKRPSDIFSFFREQNYRVERINTHWHFVPKSPSIINRIMSKAYGFVLDHPGIKLFLKRLLRVEA
jgi:FkbM family methyltransferase